jgi:hypothetical protein
LDHLCKAAAQDDAAWSDNVSNNLASFPEDTQAVGVRKRPISGLHTGIVETASGAREAAAWGACRESGSSTFSQSTHSGSGACSELTHGHCEPKGASADAVLFPSKPVVAFGSARRWPRPSKQPCATSDDLTAKEASAEGVHVIQVSRAQYLKQVLMFST